MVEMAVVVPATVPLLTAANLRLRPNSCTPYYRIEILLAPFFRANVEATLREQ